MNARKKLKKKAEGERGKERKNGKIPLEEEKKIISLDGAQNDNAF